MAPHLQAVDDSREGELLRRYEIACERLFFRHIDEVYRQRAEKAQRGEPAHTGGYFRPSPTWFQARNFRDELADVAERDECTDPCDSLEASHNGPNPKFDIRDSKPEVRNEPNGVSGPAEAPVLRNEPNGVGEPPVIQLRLSEMTAAVEQALASQPPPAISAGQRRDRSHGNAVTESRGRRKRRERNRQNAERAAAARANGRNKG